MWTTLWSPRSALPQLVGPQFIGPQFVRPQIDGVPLVAEHPCAKQTILCHIQSLVLHLCVASLFFSSLARY